MNCSISCTITIADAVGGFDFKNLNNYLQSRDLYGEKIFK